MHSLGVRRATFSDIESLRALAFSIWREYYPAVISTEQIEYMLATMFDAEVIRGEMERGVVWELATLEDESPPGAAKPVGFLSFGPLEGRSIKLHKLYFLPRLHGRGLGRQAIAHLVESASRAGAKEIWLQVNKGNTRAIHAYQRAGFHVVEEIVVDIGGGFVMDDFVMRRTV